MLTPACWPTDQQELLLHACFAPEEEARQALDACRDQLDSPTLDPVTGRLLSLLYHRWGNRLSERAYLAHVGIWRSNQRRFLMALAIARDLQRDGVDCLFLKGVALTAAHYRDPALRGMEDVDFLVRPQHVEGALQCLLRAGWIPEEGAGMAEILLRRRVRHAWQFHRGEDESCDLHWHPVVRCFSPSVASLFWDGARTAELLHRPILVPCPTDQLFHTCAHGLQWSWTPQIRWVPDSLTVLREPAAIDWDRLQQLAAHAAMNLRLHFALEYLRRRFDAPVPVAVIEHLRAAGANERREYQLLQKECPLGLADRLWWHLTNFQRIRRFDDEWSRGWWGKGFTQYVALFGGSENPLR